MRVPYDLKLEAVALYREHPASTVIEILGLNVQPRTVQRWALQVHGHPVSRQQLQRHDPLRTRVVALMVAGGLDEHYCLEGHRSFHPCLIRELARDRSIESLAFVCAKHRHAGDC